MIKADILKLVEEEELKMKNIAQEKVKKENMSKMLTYEEYYGVNAGEEIQSTKSSNSMLGSSRKDTKYEAYL